MNGRCITVGLVGAGYACHLHCNGYRKVYGATVRLKKICDVDEVKARKAAAKFEIEETCSNVEEILDDRQIDVIDICTPPFSHSQMIKDVMSAGKHVICEKPLTGYFGRGDDPEPIGEKVSKMAMYKHIDEEIRALKAEVEHSDRLFMYAENYVYAPVVQKAAEIIRNKKSRILFVKGEESLAGSSSPVAGFWNKTGGGSLIRVGCHPLSGILWLKRVEALARGENITVEKVCCDTGRTTSGLKGRGKGYIKADPVDVEDLATLTLTFSDGSKALVIAADTVLGGTNNYIEIYANDASMICRLTPPGNMDTYFLDGNGLDDVAIAEMLPTYAGWQHVFVADEVLRGYTGELQDFMECILYDRKPISDFDLACETIRTIYGAYLSAEEGRTVFLNGPQL